MRTTLLRVLNTLVITFVIFGSSNAQNVQSLDYWLKYDPTTCWYDFHIIILDGYAEGPGQRTQFSSQVSLVIQTGSTISIVELYLPLQSNQNYTSTTPTNWNFGPTISNPVSSPGNDFISITPSLVPASQYNNIYAGDTLKLFSLSIDSPQDCGEGIRVYQNGVDPSSSDPGMSGADYSNGFTIGSFNQLYNGNAPEEGPQPPEIVSITDNSGADIDIDLEVSGAACQGAIDYQWSGPNGFTGTEEDVFISPASSEI